MAETYWKALEQLFNEAAELPPEEVTAFLTEACQDRALREEVKELLKVRPTLLRRADQPLVLSALPEENIPQFKPGETIGPYRIDRLLGRGGMGAVYLADRADQEFQRQVAIKILQGNLLQPQLILRFKHERQILADLNHPNIAKMFEGGTTGEGIPYLVMEYLQGEPVTAYCKREKLPLNARLNLFIKICEAVQFAHQNLIVHGDLKPSNILVDAAGNPKLLDFGIAELMHSDGVAAGEAQRAQMLTPGYASPEQIRGEKITAASDVYSLGVLFFNLLTHHHPYGIAGLGYAALKQVICNEIPLAPSAFLTQQANGNHRQAAAWRRHLPGDLDHIAGKALAKDAGARFPTAQGMADEVRRYLGGFPLRSRQGSRLYKTGKYLKRNKLFVATMTLTVLLPISFGIARNLEKEQIALERDRAEQARNQAQIEAKTAERALNFLTGMFELAEPGYPVDEQITAKQILDLGYQKMKRDIAAEPVVQARLISSMGRVYQHLGDHKTALELLEGALEAYQRQFGQIHIKVAEAHLDLADLHLRRGEFEQSEASLNQVFSQLEQIEGVAEKHWGNAFNQMGILRVQQGRYHEGVTQLEKALAIGRRTFKGMHPDLAVMLESLGQAYYFTGKFTRAETVLAGALTINRSYWGPEHIHVVHVLNLLGSVQINLGHYDDAVETLHESLAIAEKLWEPDHESIAGVIQVLARAYAGARKNSQALNYYQQALAINQKLYPEGHLCIAANFNDVAHIYKKLGHLKRAGQGYSEALAMTTKIVGRNHPHTARGYNNLAAFLVDMGNLATAENHYMEALDILKNVLGEDNLYMGYTYSNLAILQNLKGEFETARATINRSLSILRNHFPEGHGRIANGKSILGAILMGMGSLEQAEKLMLESYQTLLTLEGVNQIRAQKAAKRLIQFYEKTGQPNKAATYRDM